MSYEYISNIEHIKKTPKSSNETAITTHESTKYLQTHIRSIEVQTLQVNIRAIDSPTPPPKDKLVKLVGKYLPIALS